MVSLKKVFIFKKVKFLYIKSLLFALFLFFFNSNEFAAVLVKGDSTVVGQSFTFCTGGYAIDATGQYFYIVSSIDGAKDFTVSRFGAFEKEFKPLCPSEVEIFSQNAQTNPIYNKGIKFFSLLDMRKDGGVTSYPVLVTNASPNKIYVLDLSKYFGRLYEEKKIETKKLDENKTVETKQDKPDNKSCSNNSVGLNGMEADNSGGSCSVKISKISVIPFDNIRDAIGNPITQINGIASSPAGYIFAGVDIGASSGGIALMVIVNARLVKNQVIEDLKAADDLAALEVGKKSPEKPENNTKNGNSKKNNAKNNPKNKNQETNNQKTKEPEAPIFKALFAGTTQPLNLTSSVAKITSDLAAINFSDMYWDEYLKCLFIALEVKAGSGSSDGGKALVLGKIDKSGALVLSDFASDSVFSGQNQIVGGVGSGAQVSLHKVRTMHTSNRLNYVVVLGANGTAAATKKSVYALPIVFDPLSDNGCMLADKNSLPVSNFAGPIIKRFVSRFLKDKAVNSSQTYTLNDDAVKVGFGDLTGDISDIFVSGDAVFALVKSPENNGNGGLFISRALFDQYGKIKRWTSWENISSSTAPIFGGLLNPVYGDFIFMSGADSSNVNTVKYTVWSDGDESGIKNLSEVMTQEFPKNIAGVQGLFEFPYSQLGAPYGMSDITLLVSTGYKKVVLTELAQLSGGVLVRNTVNFSNNLQSFTGGQITSNFPKTGTRVVSVSGGVLDNIGAIQAATVTNVGSNNGRLFVGGVNGLAVLVDNNGNGWTTGLGPNFAGLTNTMAFRSVGNFTFVRKLLQDGNYLYILTDNKLYRANLISGSNNFVTGILDVTEIASFINIAGLNKYSSFLDFVASGKLGILATTDGLFRIGNGLDVSTVNVSSAYWSNVPVPTTLGPIKQLFTISSTSREQDVFTQNGNGVVYALGSYYGNNTGQYNRFTINYGAQVTDTTIMPLPDYYVQTSTTGVGANSYFMNFGQYRNILQDEGAIRYVSQQRNLTYSPFLNILMPGLECGLTLPETQSKTLLLAIENDSQVVRILRSSTGPVIVAGDFGFRVNE